MRAMSTLPSPRPVALIGAPTLLAGRSRGAGIRLAGVFACAMGVYGLLSAAPFLIALAGGPQPDAPLFTLPELEGEADGASR